MIDAPRRHRLWWMVAALVLVTFAFTLFPLVSTGAFTAPEASASSGKSFSLTSLITDATVTPEGDLVVVEQITYRFRGGPFTVGIRSFERDRSQVVGFEAFEDGSPLRVDPPNRTPTGEWEWHFATPARDESRSFELRYRVEGAIAVGPDVGELYWQFVGTDHPGIDLMEVRVTVPGSWPPAVEGLTADDDTTVMRVWGHGPPSGSVELLPDGARAEVRDVPGGRFVELRLLVPSAAFTVEPSGEPRLERVLREERSYLDRLDREERRKDLAGIFAPFAAIMGALVTGALWFTFGREPRPNEQLGRYWREPLADPPAVTLKNLRRRGFPAGQAIGATLIDLAQRGHLTITAAVVKRLGPDKTVHTFHRADTATSELKPFEARLLSMVLRGQESMSSDELTEWGKANRTDAAKELEQFTDGVTREYKLRGYGTGLPWLGALLLVGATLLVAGAGWLAVVWEQPLGWIAIVVAPLMLVVGLLLLWNRNPHSATELARAQSARRFLADFSNLEEAPIGHLILWERHLVDAVTLGVSKELLDGLSVKLPQVVDDPGFAPWYAGTAVGARRRVDGVSLVGASVGPAIASSFQPPSSSSGGGGGFSGGGGGGGGGGGFGAR